MDKASAIGLVIGVICLAASLFGWLLAAVSMIGQYLGSVLVPEAPFAVVATFFAFATLILLPIKLRYRKDWFNKKEVAGGALNGLIQAVSIFVTPSDERAAFGPLSHLMSSASRPCL